MSKKKNVNDTDSNRFHPSNGPDFFHMDDVGYMLDDEISQNASRLESERNQLLSKGHDPYLWEIELCYLRREQQLRKLRLEKHDEYLASRSFFESDEHELVNLSNSRGDNFVNVRKSMN